MPDPSFAPALVWLATQLVPSPQIAAAREGAVFGLEWQLTPVLYSFGVHRDASPWRAFVAEPRVRHVGSVELFAAPEYLALRDVPDRAKDRWFVRPGARAYFPLARGGEYLSWSLGVSYAWGSERSGAAYEVGAYTLFGIFGVRIAWAPQREPADVIATLAVRYF
jgi:hypothetical protein